MKKILLATTMLIGTAGFAAAEVTISGDARMGVVNNHVLGAGADDTVFTSRARVSFGLSGESDSGLSFGASFRADNAGAAAGGTAGSVFVSAGGFKLSMGDVDGGATAAVGQVDGVGMTGLGDVNELIHVGNGGLGSVAGTGVAAGGTGSLTGDPSILASYSAGALTVYASATQAGHTFAAGGLLAAGNWEGSANAVGVAYSVDAYKFSLGYESVSLDQRTGGTAAVDINHLLLGADATFGQITVKARYGNGDLDVNGVAAGDISQSAVSAAYTMDALSVSAFVSQKSVENAAGVNLISIDGMGVGASYDLGGGASLVGGIAKNETQVGTAAAQDDTAFDLGLTFSF